MAMSCDFDAIPRSITSGGSVRFFPRVAGNTSPITNYHWEFGDTSAHVDGTLPVHQYDAVASLSTFNVTLTVTDSDSNTATITHNNFISSDTAGHVLAPPNDGTYQQISVLIYDDTNSMLVNRLPWTNCHLYLMYPKIINRIDKIGDATFSLVDIGDSSATEKSLMEEGKFVVIVQGKTIVFSGKIRRITQNTQNGFTTSTRVKLWDVECDSDLAKLSKINVDSSILTNGSSIYNTPGYIARMILTPSVGVRDTRGVINCIDSKVSYNLNSSTTESVGDQYTHIMNLLAATNYDLRSRPDFLLYPYASFNGTDTITIPGAFTNDEFVGAYVFFVGRDIPSSKTFTTDYATNNDRLLITTASTYFAVNDRVTLSTTGTLPTGLSTAYYVKSVTSTYITVSTTLGGAAATFSTDGTGTHSIILVAETLGVQTYGKVTGNDGTTLTATIVNPVAPTSLGYILIYRGYLIDFAHDLSQPTPIKNYDVNVDTFDYSDNDDKRKLSTKVVVTGKDLQGVTISVAVSAVHTFEIDRQFYNDSTFVTKNSEGYIYANTYATDRVPVTLTIGESAMVWTSQYVGGVFYIYVATAHTLLVGETITIHQVGGTLPSGLNDGYTYYVVAEPYANYYSVSSTLNGSPITIGGGSGGPWTYDSHGLMSVPKYTFSSSDYIVLTGTTAPTGLAFGTQYSATDVFTLAGVEYFTINGWSTASTGTSVYLHKVTAIVNPGYTTTYAPTAYIWVYGWEYAIPSGTVMAIVYGSTAITITTSGATSEETWSDNTKVTKVPIGTTMFNSNQNFSGKGYLLSPRIYVDDYAQVGTNEVLIGEERITVTGTGTDTTHGQYIDIGTATDRVSSATLKCYPHGTGALVARTNYTEASPETGSPIDLYGLYIDQRAVDTNITYATLDTYATSLLVGLGNFYRKATTWGTVVSDYVPIVGEYYGGISQSTLSIPPRAGDRISFTEYTGGTPTEIQIVTLTIDYDNQKITFELGDYEKNVFTSLKQSTNAVNSTLT